jgi:hypothetical protein
MGFNRLDIQRIRNGHGFHHFFGQCFNGQAKHEYGRHPIGHIDMGVEIPLHQFFGVALETAPIILIGETHRRNCGPRRKRAQLSYLVLCQWSVDGEKFVILIFTHDSVFQTYSSESLAFLLRKL